MSTKIKDPTANTPTSGRGSGIIGGAAQGAAAGAAVGSVVPVVGTAVGAVAGAFIGAVSGYISGSANDQAARYANLASKYTRLRKEREAAIVRRNALKDFRMQRAAAMTMIGNEAGGTRSSAPQGAVSSLGAQYGFNLSYFDADAYLQGRVDKLYRQAGKAQQTANVTSAATSAVFSSAASMAGSYGSFFSPSAGRGYSGLGSETLNSSNWVNSPMKQDFSWIQAPKYNI